MKIIKTSLFIFALLMVSASCSRKLNDNSNQQQRFVTLIDILYEKKIPLMISSESQLNLISSSKSLENVFKRTISRLYELTSIKYN